MKLPEKKFSIFPDASIGIPTPQSRRDNFQFSNNLLNFVVLLIFTCCFLAFPQKVSAAFSGGINIGDHFNEFDQAANLSGGTGWVYTMMQPEDWPKLAGFLTKYPNLNIIVRGHYPDVALTSDYAQRWVDGLVNLSRPIYFVPVNEPNNPKESSGGISAKIVLSYINSLKSELNSRGLLSTGKVILLSPAIDIYRLSDVGADYINQLGGWSFFSQFEGICLNLYGQFDGSALDPNAPLIKKGQGYRDFLKTHFGADATSAQNAKIFAVETGVMKLQDAKVKYKENAAEIITYLNTVKPIWGVDSNFVMYAIFSYDPGAYPSSPWIYDQKGVLSAMGLKGEETAVSPTPVTPSEDFEKIYKRLKDTNQALAPREIQAKEDPECLFKIFGRCLIKGEEARDPKYEARLAYESNKYQPVLVPQEKVVSLGEVEDKCDLFCAIGRAFGLVPQQLSSQQSGAFQAYLPRSVGSKSEALKKEENQLSQNTTEGSVLAAATNADREIKEKFADLRCLVLPRQFSDKCLSELASVPKSSPTPVPGGPSPSSQPTPTPGEGQPPSGTCPFGTGDCDINYLSKKNNQGNPVYFPNIGAATIASMICQRESGSDPFAENKQCLAVDPAERTADYSIGLFQINLLAQCQAGIGYTPDPLSCTPLDPVALEECEQFYHNGENNIRKAVNMSENGSNWNPWWTASDQCELVTPTPPPLRCSAGGEFLYLPGATYQHLNDQQDCMQPRIIVIHWSGGWSSAQTTFNILNDRGLSCQLAIDSNNTLQMLDYYNSKTESGSCVGSADQAGISYNSYALNIEISGAFFDEIINDPSHPRYQELISRTDKAIDATCWMLKQYNIDKSQIFGHYELYSGKSDPGPEYLRYFKNRVQTECN